MVLQELYAPHFLERRVEGTLVPRCTMDVSESSVVPFFFSLYNIKNKKTPVYAQMAGTNKRSYSFAFGNSSTSRKSAKTAPVRKRQTKRNAPVRRVYRNYRQVPRTKTGVNKSAIYTLAKQVKSLQNQRFGPVQTHILRGAIFNTSLGTEIPNANSIAPTCFLLNDFLAPKNVFYGRVVSSGVPSSEPGPDYGQLITLSPQTYDTGLQDGGEWNAKRNLSTASRHQYKPLYSRVVINVDMTLSATWTPKRMRVTLLKVIPMANTFQSTHALPYALGSYRYLAENPAASNANFFWRGKYHTILYDKIKVIRNNLDTEKRQFTFNCRYKYPDSYLVSPHLTSVPGGQTVFTNTKISNQIWCLISYETGFTAAVNKIGIMQADSWRDTQGHSETLALMTQMAELHDQYLHPEEQP